MNAPNDFTPGVYTLERGEGCVITAVEGGGREVLVTRGGYQHKIHVTKRALDAYLALAGIGTPGFVLIVGEALQKISEQECGAQPSGHSFYQPPPRCTSCGKVANT